MPDHRDTNGDADAGAPHSHGGESVARDDTADAGDGSGPDAPRPGDAREDARDDASTKPIGVEDTQLLIAGANAGTEPAAGTEDTMFATTGDSVIGVVRTAKGRRPGTEGRTRIMPVDIGTQLGRYVIEDELGAGGMATVFSARDLKLRRVVAIKVLFPHLARRAEVVARFQREARAAAALDHTNILRVFDVGGGEVQTDAAGNRVIEPPYIVMELVRGRSLHEFLQDLDEPPLAETVACVGAVMCAALAEAHAAGIVHRDVKPANIMVSEEGRLALADFGVARIEGDDSSLVTRAGALLGTPAFMSPEQAAGKPLDARSDIYSLGATLYRLATGHAPFSGPTARLVAAIARGEKRPPAMRNPALGSEMARIIERMMAPDVDERYESSTHVGVTLTEVVKRSGLDEPDKELVEFFADPEGYRRAHEPEIARVTLERAREAARERSIPRALALSDRVLALVPDDSPEAEAAMGLVRNLGAGQRRLRWLVVALAVVLLGAGLWTGAMWLAGGSDGSSDRAANRAIDAGVDAAMVVADASRPAPVVADAAIPPDARVERPDARRRRPVDHGGRRPKPVDAGPTRRADAQAAPRVVPIDARVPAIDAAPARAVITLAIKPWCDVFIDGVAHGRARLGMAIELPPGAHQVVCTQGPGRPRWQRTVTLQPGERKALRGSVLVSVQISVAVELGDRVTIDGRTIKNGESLELPPDKYRVQVLDGGDNKGGGWIPVPVVGSCTIRDRPSLACYP